VYTCIDRELGVSCILSPMCSVREG
jgi:hypothetical protein